MYDLLKTVVNLASLLPYFGALKRVVMIHIEKNMFVIGYIFIEYKIM
jgi:hypothetical protein